MTVRIKMTALARGNAERFALIDFGLQAQVDFLDCGTEIGTVTG